MPNEIMLPMSAPIDASKSAASTDLLGAMLLHYEVEKFLYDEAALLDERQYSAWLELFTQDVSYWMPIRRTKTTKDQHREFTAKGEMAFIDDDHAMLAMRVKRLKTGYAWAEDPPSRVRRLITNVRVVAVEDDTIDVHSNFNIYRTRLNSDEDSWIGHREDRLRRVDGKLMICARSIFLEQTVLLSPNLSNFF